MNPQTSVPDNGSDSVSFSQTESPYIPNKHRGIKRWLGESRAYLVEYALVLISIAGLLSIVISMLNIILKYNQDDYGYFSSFAYTVSISMIASLIVIIPLVLVLSKRNSALESEDPEIRNLGWRKGFLGFFLLNIGLWGIGLSIAFVYDLVSYFASFGLSDDNVFPWRSLLANGIAAGILIFTMWLYSHDYRNQWTTKAMIRKVHQYGLIGLAILLTLIYMATAFKNQRASFIDDTISSDLSSIQSDINEDRSGSRNSTSLPSSLSDIKLNDQQKSRATKYGYTYTKGSGSFELCAIFKTDTKSKDTGNQNPLEAISGSSYSYNDYDTGNSNPHEHGKGKQCFETKVYDDRYNDVTPLNSREQNSLID